MVDTREEFYRLGLQDRIKSAYAVFMWSKIKKLKLPHDIKYRGKDKMGRRLIRYFMSEQDWKKILEEVNHEN